MTWVLVNTSTFQSVANTDLIVDTTASEITITLPTNPVAGEYVTVADASDWSINNLSIISEQTIDGSNNNVILTAKGSQYQFVYTGSTWKMFNLSKAQKSITELEPVQYSNISDDDYFLVIDVNSTLNTSNKITFSDLKSKITEVTYTTANSIINDINSETTAFLDVSFFDGQESSYYLDYENITNAPLIPTKTSDLSNDGYNSTDGLTYIVNFDGFDTDDLDEGNVNKYFNQTNFDSFFDIAFSESYRLYSGEFSEIQARDSFDNIEATPFTTIFATDTISVNLDKVSNFYVGQKLRIFGGSIDTTVLTAPTISSASAIGFSSIVNSSVLSYRIAEFDMSNGKISPHSTESNSVTVDFDQFNVSNTVSVIFNRNSTNNGILVYRSINGGGYNLIDVLGQNQLGNITSSILYVDYGTFGYTTWSEKNSLTGAYTNTTGIVHFPIVSSGSTKKGWVDAEVTGVESSSGEITLSESFNFSSTLTVSENDTTNIQSAIDTRYNNGINSLELNDRTYIVSSLRIPDGFSLYGKGKTTNLKKLSWSTESSLNMVYASGMNNNNISIGKMTVDGNQQNQWLRNESTGYDNYAIKVIGTNTSINEISVRNVVGGGIYSPESEKIILNLSRIEDSGMNDIQEFSPFVANDCTDIVVTNNVFKNFTQNIDLSTTYIGVFSNNVVDNCGSGVLIFGSRYLISSPNLISGPAGEYISSPDILNSEYSSVDINLEYGMSYTSPSFVYQENGELFDLTANRADVSYGVFKLRKVDNVEEEYGEVLISSITPISNIESIDINPEEGEFKFAINQSNVNELLTTYGYSTLKAIDNNHVGLIYKAGLAEYVQSGSIQSQVIETDDTQYTINVSEYSNLYVGANVRLLNHGGTPNLDNLVGTVININDILATGPNPVLIVTIQYGESIVTAGSGGNITVENTFLLAKGRL